MLHDLRTILTIALFLAPICFLIGYLTTRNEVPDIVIQPTFLKDSSPKIQSRRQRAWRKYEFERVSIIDSHSVRYPAHMKVNASGKIYVLDWHDFRVKVFSPSAILLGMTGRGRAGGAFANPTGFAVDRENGIWICDPVQGQIARFDANGDLVQSISPKFLAYRLAVIEDRMITMTASAKKTLFDIYDLSGNWLKSLGTFVENQLEYNVSLDGCIVADDESQGFIYGGLYVGILAGYGIDGKQRFLVQTIDRLPLPEIGAYGDMRRVEARDRIAILSMSIYGENLYILRGTPRSNGRKSAEQVVDVHSKRNGGYLFSFTIPITCAQAIFRPDRMYTRGEDGVTVWRVMSPHEL